MRVVAAVLLAAGVAAAAGPRPFFQVPGSCGQVWHASTYSNHWPDPDSLDLTTRDSNLGNTGFGEPVRAAAAGTVTDVFTRASDGENRIYVDHGDGWTSHYIHVQNPLPTHLIGQQVAQGQVLAYTGDTGNTVPHIHFTQLEDGSAVRSAFSGELVETHQADTSTWGHWGTSNAEELLSNNCAGEQFMQWTEGSTTYMLIYKQSVGTVKIVRVAGNGEGTTTTWSGTWSLQYTHMQAYKIGSSNYAILYKASTGKVVFIKLNANGAGYQDKLSGTWGKGWTDIVVFQNGGQPYLLVYNQVWGYANFEYVNADNVGTTNIYKGTWQFGRTLLKSYMRAGVHYMLLYKGGSGEAEFFSVAFSGTQKPVWTLKKTEQWTAGWSHFALFYDSGIPHAVAYKQHSGDVKFLRMDANGQGVTTTYSSTWSKPYTHFTTFQLGLRGGLFLYKTGSGFVRTIRIQSGAAAYDNLWTASWTSGYN